MGESLVIKDDLDDGAGSPADAVDLKGGRMVRRREDGFSYHLAGGLLSRCLALMAEAGEEDPESSDSGWTDSPWIHPDAGIHAFDGNTPDLGPDTFVFPGARLVGEVSAGEGTSFWYQCVVRADLAPVVIGRNCNIQDQCLVHVARNRGVILGDRVTVGHQAVLHACNVGSDVLIGMHATVMDGAVISDGCIIAAGALVPPGMVIPPGSLVAGLPAKVVRSLRPEEIEDLADQALRYRDYARESRDGL